MFKIVQRMKLRLIDIVSAAHKSAYMLHILNSYLCLITLFGTLCCFLT